MILRRRLSRSAATPKELPAGSIVGCFGIKGELKCDTTRAARALFVQGAEFRYEAASGSGCVRLAGVRPRKRDLLLSLEGVNDRTASEQFVGAILYVPKTAIELAPLEYLDGDLIGCAVIGQDGKNYGPVARVEHYPSCDMLVVAGSMVPMVSAIVRDIDLAKKQIVIDPPEGLI